MNRNEASAAIKAILAAMHDTDLPAPTKIEQGGGDTLVWFGGHGRYLGTAKRNGVHDPSVYRDSAAREAIELEAMYRLDVAHHTPEPSA